MDPDDPVPPAERVLLPGAPIPADGIGAYPLFLHALGVALRQMPTLFWIYLPVAAVSSALLFVGAPTAMNPDPAIPPGELHIPLNEWIAVTGCFLFMFSFGAWSAAAVFRSAYAALTTGRALGFGAAHGSAIDRVPSYVATQFLYVVVLIAGFVACCVPGFWWGVLFAPALPRSATRPVGPIQALRESKGLVRGRYWRAAGFLGLVVMTVYAFNIPSFVLSNVLPHDEPWSIWVRGIVGTIAASVLVPIQACADVALHERLEETA